MRSINSIGIDAASERVHYGTSPVKHARVLPRPLRLAYRSIRRIFAGDVHLPSHIGSYATVAFFSATLLYGAAIGGHLPQVFAATTNSAGLSAHSLRIEGTHYTDAGDIASALGLDQNRSLVGINVADARQKILSLPWVKEASIVKSYPASIQVDIEERKPFAIWKNNGAFFVIEEDGAVIAPLADDAAFHHLPLILGDGAAKLAADFLKALSEQPEMAMLVEQISRVAGQRWDLQLVNGIVVMLPEEGALDALAAISEMDRTSQLLERDIIAIDMRVPDRMALRLSLQAAAESKQLIEARKRAEKRVEEGFDL